MDLSDAYENGAYIPNAVSYPPRWLALAAGFRALMLERSKLDQAYGKDPRQKLDLFFPLQPPKGLVMFIHGGYWLKFDKNHWSHLAEGAVKRGWAVAMPSYRLAPDVQISDITRDAVAALTLAGGDIAGPIVVAGHSAGGHLAARLACEDVLPATLAGRVKRVMAISPLSDLRPLMQTQMNAALGLDLAQAEAESPVFERKYEGTDALIWVGAEERPAFLDQARWLSDAWDDARLHIAPDKHHFDVIDGLSDPNHAMTLNLLDGLV